MVDVNEQIKSNKKKTVISVWSHQRHLCANGPPVKWRRDADPPAFLRGGKVRKTAKGWRDGRNGVHSKTLSGISSSVSRPTLQQDKTTHVISFHSKNSVQSESYTEQSTNYT